MGQLTLQMCRGPRLCVSSEGFPRSSVGEESTCNAGDPGSIPRWGRFPEEGNGNPLQDSCLENPMDRGAWQATVHGIPRVRHDLATKPPPPRVHTFHEWGTQELHDLASELAATDGRFGEPRLPLQPCLGFHCCDLGNSCSLSSTLHRGSLPAERLPTPLCGPALIWREGVGLGTLPMVSIACYFTPTLDFALRVIGHIAIVVKYMRWSENPSVMSDSLQSHGILQARTV